MVSQARNQTPPVRPEIEDEDRQEEQRQEHLCEIKRDLGKLDPEQIARVRYITRDLRLAEWIRTAAHYYVHEITTRLAAELPPDITLAELIELLMAGDPRCSEIIADYAIKTITSAPL